MPILRHGAEAAAATGAAEAKATKIAVSRGLAVRSQFEVYAAPGTRERPTRISVTCRPLSFPRFQCAWSMRDSLYGDRYSGLARATLSLDRSRAVLYRLQCTVNQNSSVGGDLSCLLPYRRDGA